MNVKIKLKFLLCMIQTWTFNFQFGKNFNTFSLSNCSFFFCFNKLREWFLCTCDRFNVDGRTEFCKIWSHERKFTFFFFSVAVCRCSSVSSLAHATSSRMNLFSICKKECIVRLLSGILFDHLFRLYVRLFSLGWLRPSCIGSTGSRKSKSGNVEWAQTRWEFNSTERNTYIYSH